MVCLYLGDPSDLDPSRLIYTLTASGSGFDWTSLVPKEPEYANDAPSAEDIAEWFVYSLGLFAIAAAAAIAVRKLSPRCNPRTVFVVLAFSLGVIGTTVIGSWFDTFIWTWPISLYIAFRSVITLGLDRTKTGWRHQLSARLALLLFIALCYGYYRLCMAVGFAMAWGFLGGFVPALPLAAFANRVTNPKIRWLFEVLGFVVYFWTSGLIPACKAAWVD